MSCMIFLVILDIQQVTHTGPGSYFAQNLALNKNISISKCHMGPGNPLSQPGSAAQRWTVRLISLRKKNRCKLRTQTPESTCLLGSALLVRNELRKIPLTSVDQLNERERTSPQTLSQLGH